VTSFITAIQQQTPKPHKHSAGDSLSTVGKNSDKPRQWNETLGDWSGLSCVRKRPIFGQRPTDAGHSDYAGNNPISPNRQITPEREVLAVINIKRGEQQDVGTPHPHDMDEDPMTNKPAPREESQCRRHER